MSAVEVPVTHFLRVSEVKSLVLVSRAMGAESYTPIESANGGLYDSVKNKGRRRPAFEKRPFENWRRSSLQFSTLDVAAMNGRAFLFAVTLLLLLLRGRKKPKEKEKPMKNLVFKANGENKIKLNLESESYNKKSFLNHEMTLTKSQITPKSKNNEIRSANESHILLLTERKFREITKPPVMICAWRMGEAILPVTPEKSNSEDAFTIIKIIANNFEIKVNYLSIYDSTIENHFENQLENYFEKGLKSSFISVNSDNSKSNRRYESKNSLEKLTNFEVVSRSLINDSPLVTFGTRIYAKNVVTSAEKNPKVKKHSKIQHNSREIFELVKATNYLTNGSQFADKIMERIPRQRPGSAVSGRRIDLNINLVRTSYFLSA